MTQMTSAAREDEDIVRAVPREREGGASRSLATTPKITSTTPAKPKTSRKRLNKKLGHHTEGHIDHACEPKTSRKRLHKKLGHHKDPADQRRTGS